MPHPFNSLPDQKYLQECFRYDKKSGVLIWRKRPSCHFHGDWRLECVFRSRYEGKIAGCPDPSGYVKINLDAAKYLGHRLAYHLLRGGLKDGEFIDHIDGNPHNNRIENLRKCAHAENIMNQAHRTAAMTKNVSWSSVEKKYRVEVKAYSKRHYIGSFATLSAAKAAAHAARKKIHRQFNCERAK